MTRGHLGELLRQIMNALPDLPDGSIDRDAALTNLQMARIGPLGSIKVSAPLKASIGRLWPSP
jgi:hypothetical protein